MKANFQMRSIFFNDLNQIQWIWRLLIFLIIYAVAAMVIRVWFQVYDPTGTDVLLSTLWQVLKFVVLVSITLGLTWAVLRAVDKRAFASFGLSFHSRWFQELLYGLIAGAVLTMAFFVFMWVLGLVSIAVQPVVWSDLAALVVSQLVLWSLAGLAAEMFLRGYVLQVLSEGQGKIFATLFLSFVTALIQTQFHPDRWIHGVNLAVWNVLLCVCYFRTRTLWVSTGLQTTSSFLQSAIFGTTVMGIHPTFSFFSVNVTSRGLISGDYFGLQQGVLAGSLLVIALYYLLHTRQMTIDDEVRKAKFEALNTPFRPKSS